jgi:hypothetical protein
LVSRKKEKKKKTENFEFSLNVRQGFRNNDSVDVKRLNNCRKTEFFYEKVFTNKVIFLYNKYVHIEIRNTIRTTLD